jgi:hypothetical protein
MISMELLQYCQVLQLLSADKPGLTAFIEKARPLRAG